MNGVTGTIRGEYPKSPWKIALPRARARHRRVDRAVVRIALTVQFAPDSGISTRTR
jgi:hypothetical protein